jgi:hypothetical protein
MESIDTGEIDCDNCLIMQEILSDEIEDEEFLNFAIENLDELSSYIIYGNLNIRIHRSITSEVWFGVGQALTFNVVQILWLQFIQPSQALRLSDYLPCQIDSAFPFYANA